MMTRRIVLRHSAVSFAPTVSIRCRLIAEPQGRDARTHRGSGYFR
jgi:hypothetical protein